MAVFFLVWVGIGAIVGLLVRTVPHALADSRASSTVTATSVTSTWTPVFVGVAVCAVLAILGIVYSLTAGAQSLSSDLGCRSNQVDSVSAGAQSRGRPGNRRGNSHALRCT